MSTQIAQRETTAVAKLDDMASQQFVSVYVDDQLFGIPVLDVHDVIRPERIFKIPLAPKDIAGSLNLRGRIVTAIDVRTRLSLPPLEMSRQSGMCVVVESKGELYSLVVDSVGEVLSLYDHDFESSPSTLDPKWKEVSKGVYQLQDKLLVVLDVSRLLRFYSEEK